MDEIIHSLVVLEEELVLPETLNYTYAYEETARGRLSGISVCGLTIKPKYDILNRHKGKELLIGREKIAEEERVYRKIGDRATDIPSAVYFGSKETGMYALNGFIFGFRRCIFASIFIVKFADDFIFFKVVDSPAKDNIRFHAGAGSSLFR